MVEAPPTFSESWYRVAQQRVALRPTVEVHRQRFRGEIWHVLHDPFTGQFFRLRPAAYEFVARLRPDRSVEEVWKESLERSPEDAPGQEAVLQLLGQLYRANLLQYPGAADAPELFKRYQGTRKREIRGRFLNIMFARIPLLDPDAFLVRTLPALRWLMGPLGAVLWLAVVGWGLKVAADHFLALKDEAQGVLAPDNLFLLYLGLAIVKTLHEFGHAYLCRRFGGEVHTMGILFMIFTPVPYVDVTSAWAFRERWQRVLVGLGGVIVEIFVAAVATMVWAATGPGTIHGLAYNIMFVASVSTLVVNLNPLLRFDGYYVLSDLIGIPNLGARANRQVRYWTEKFLFGLRQDQEPARSRKEAAWLGTFGVASGIYRVLVFAGILLAIADRFLLIGLLMAAVCAVAWILVPLWRLVHYLATSPRLDRQRPRAVAVTVGLALVLVVFLRFVPFPSHFRAPGVVRSREWSEVHNETGGRVTRVLVEPGSTVTKGQALLELENPELELNLVAARAQRAETEGRIRQALHEAVPNLLPLQRLLEAHEKTVATLEGNASNLVVRAAHDGLWVFPRARELRGSWLPQGGELGVLVNPSGFEFHAVVEAGEVDRLFERSLGPGEVRLRGEAGRVLPLIEARVNPAGQNQLPSAALGWLAGGPVRTRATDERGVQTAEPFFEVRGALGEAGGATLLHGRSGTARFDLPPEPLLPRWIRSLRQLLQRRYQL